MMDIYTPYLDGLKMPKPSSKQKRMVSVFCCISCHSSSGTMHRLPGKEKAYICTDCVKKLERRGEVPLYGGELTLVIADGRLEVVSNEKSKADTCVSCGTVIPEGRQVCPGCNV